MSTNVAPSQWVLDRASQKTRDNVLTGHASDDCLSVTHGFTLAGVPLLSLPESHAVWDEAGACLPLWTDQGVTRDRIKKLPELDASEQALPAEYLSRASTLLTILAHAWHAGDFLGIDTVRTTLPAAILSPWKTVAKRLGRKHIGYTIFEGVLYNWKFKNPQSGLRTVENTRLLVPLTGLVEESNAHMVLAETEASAAPLIAAVVKAQNAVIQDNKQLLESALSDMIETLAAILQSFMKINLIPGSKTYIHPVIWSKTAAVISAKYTRYEQGMSGASLPCINLIDTFIGRSSYQTEMGQQEMARRQLLPKIQQEFIAAVGKVSVKDYVLNSDDVHLQELWSEIHERYSGKKGFLSVHKRKIFNIIQMGMKTGRVTTNAGYHNSPGRVGDAWDLIDQDLEAGRLERGFSCENPIHHGRIDRITAISDTITALSIKRDEKLIIYPGDRCNLYLENSDELITKTLQALEATRQSKIELSQSWVNYLCHRLQRSVDRIFPLSDFLKYAKIRPLTRETVSIFFRLTASQRVKFILDNHLEDQFELWDFLIFLQQDNYPVQGLWKISPWQRENLSKILTPELPRAYSIASMSGQHSTQRSDEFSIMCQALEYETCFAGNRQKRQGTGTSYIRSLRPFSGAETPDKTVHFTIETPLFFPLRKLPDHPVFFFAGGVGVATFIAALQRHVNEQRQQTACLFFSVHDWNCFIFREELISLSHHKHITIYLVMTSMAYDDLSESQKTCLDESSLRVFYKKRTGDVLLEKETSDMLFHYIHRNTSVALEARFFICGGTRFCEAVEQTLLTICEKRMPDNTMAKDLILQNIANKCFSYDVYTGYFPRFQLQNGPLHEIPVSTIIQYNHPATGYWMIIDDVVYDIGEYAAKHPGGDQILFSCCGLDATENYKKVEHHLSTEIESLLSFFKIGCVKKINLDSSIQHIILDRGIKTISTQELYDAWVAFAFALVEIENRMALAFSVCNPETENTVALQTKMLHKGHLLFVQDLLYAFYHEQLPAIWLKTLGIYGMEYELFAMNKKFAHRERNDASEASIVQFINDNHDKPLVLTQFSKKMVHCDLTLLSKIKQQIIAVHRLLEEENWTPDIGSIMIKTLLTIADIVSDYPERFDFLIRGTG